MFAIYILSADSVMTVCRFLWYQQKFRKHGQFWVRIHYFLRDTKQNVILKKEVLSAVGYETEFEGTLKNVRIVPCVKRSGEYHNCTENMYDKE